MNNNSILSTILFAILTGVILLGGAFAIPWGQTSWGSFEVKPSSTITVTGEAKSQEKNQIAKFTAGITSIQVDKQAAVAEVNQKINDLIKKIKEFGIEDQDIQTQNISIHQQEERPPIVNQNQDEENGDEKKWYVNNSVNITLRDADKANQLTDLLSNSGATNVYGPNFQMEESNLAANELLDEAIQDARLKAEKIAQASNKEVGDVINVTEGVSSGPIGIMRGYAEAGMGGGASLEPGSTTVSKTVTVVFELK